MKSVPRILIVEDQRLMRMFLERWLSETPRFTLAGSSATGEAALAELDESRPDVALVDLQLPGMDGLEFVRAARQVRPQLRAIMVSSLVDALTMTRVHESGIEGYVEKDASPEMLTEALETVAAGRHWFSEKFRTTLAAEGARTDGVGKILSRREQQVLAAVLGGLQNREIAERLALGVRTVEFHRANLMAKLGASNLVELLARARSRGLAE